MAHSKIEWTNATWNPVTGCTKISQGCKNCLTPGTPVLYADMTWRPLGDVCVGDALAAFDEWPDGFYRKLKPALVEQVWGSRVPAYRITTERGEVVTTLEHRWLRRTPSAWVPTRLLRTGRTLRRIDVVESQPFTDDYRAGYICGLSRGDGTFRYTPGQRSDKLGFPQPYWRVALADEEPLGRLVAYLGAYGVEASVRPFNSGPSAKQTMQKVEVRALSRLAVIHHLLTQPRNTVDWERGWLAGFFDAEGSHGQNLRLAQMDVEVLRTAQRFGARLGLRFEIEQYVGQAAFARLAGDLNERFKFFSICQPALSRKMSALWGRMLETHDDPIQSIEPIGLRDVVDIQTSTRTFFAAGYATHNCYAERMAKRLQAMGNSNYANGFRVTLQPHMLERPLEWKKPQRIFVDSMSDLFHDDVPVEFIQRCFAVMREASWHTFQILTKRAERLEDVSPQIDWPTNVWQGVSVENSDVTFRIDHLRRTGAAVKFLSVEPLIGPMPELDLSGIHWMIVGGESGPGARLMQLEWVEDLRKQCRAAGVAFFFKQWGGVNKAKTGRMLNGRTYDELPIVT